MVSAHRAWLAGRIVASEAFRSSFGADFAKQKEMKEQGRAAALRSTIISDRMAWNRLSRNLLFDHSNRLLPDGAPSRTWLRCLAWIGGFATEIPCDIPSRR